MSNHEAIVFDDRARAFVQARELIEQAQATRQEWTQAVLDDRDTPDELPAEYWAAIAEANVLAQLAQSDPAVGYLAGAHIVASKPDRRDLRREARRRLGSVEARRSLRPEAERGTNDVAPWAEGMDVELTAGEHAGRRGRIYVLVPGERVMDVELAPPGRPDDPSEPIMVRAVSYNDVKLADV
ncbi:hypothetical protein Jolie2_49 [Mycobacterium phage Jolie2]|uniref:Uncharacterized protein n=1 Tax=Mycobacterium phage Jolie2 TaxID=1458831 RepID=W8E9H4_9CAUD|nr:hypothetical protein Jolie2_49 [Mycobacterium phage Jolie2]AHJ86599.1 hypothetical protein Jolie2_49 [Mycobacterium phage Jolie2]